MSTNTKLAEAARQLDDAIKDLPDGCEGWLEPLDERIAELREALAAHDAEQAQEAGSEQPYEKIVQMKLPGADGKQRLTDCANVAAQAVPAVRVADVGFRWDGEKQQHVPTLLVEFEPVPANSGSDAKGWRDRDAMAAMLAAAPAAPAPEAPTLTHELQQQCSDWGVYWRASDAHGVDLSIEQAEELLRRALGVEVAISKAAPQAQAAGQELPPLPEPDGTVEIDCGPAPGGGCEIVFEDGYSADQMHAYARAALAQRQPLTKQALQAEFTRQTKDSSLAYRSIAAFDGFLCGARFAERAHGIGGATTGEQR